MSSLLAQLVERGTVNLEATGSNPVQRGREEYYFGITSSVASCQLEKMPNLPKTSPEKSFTGNEVKKNSIEKKQIAAPLV